MSSAQGKKSEVRLGIVMYGGVSLAVYINGVAHEFFRAQRGRGIYGLIKKILNTDIVIDIVSGTSAGGINGILLSHALCNNVEFSDCARLWRKDGDLRRLLRNPWDPSQNTSLLDSEGYYQSHLEDAFRKMNDIKEEPGEVSNLKELDLFITGTDVEGAVYTKTDDAGHSVDIKDHRAVFHLKYRNNRKNDFKPLHENDPVEKETTIRALAKLSRITSCFPVAFAPVNVKFAKEGDKTEDVLLQKWGKIGREANFLDGGILDNKPFTPTLKEIFRRTTDRPVDRWLFYVEPNPESFTAKNPKKPEDQRTPPNIIKAVTDSLIAIPTYESIADDIKLLSEHNSKVKRYNTIVEEVEKMTGNRKITSPVDDTAKDIYNRCRKAFFARKIIDGIVNKSNNGEPELLNKNDKETAKKIINKIEEEISQLPEDKLNEIDIYFRLRRLFKITYALFEKKNIDDDSKKLLKNINRRIEVYEITISAIEKIIDNVKIDWKGNSSINVWKTVSGLLNSLICDSAPPMELSKSEKEIDTEIGDFKNTIDSKINALLKGEPYKCSTLSMLADNDKHEEAIINNCNDKEIKALYKNFQAIDTYLFPYEFGADLGEKDIVKIVRVSPSDAQEGLCNKTIEEKICGNVLGNFGGFLKRSWRSNDILLGRLDACSILVECLFNDKKLAELKNANSGIEKILKDEYGESLGLELYLKLDDSKTYTEFRKIIIEHEQSEILKESLPDVFEDAINEQFEWNRFNSGNIKSNGVKKYDPAKGSFDSLVTTVAASELARKSIQEIKSNQGINEATDAEKNTISPKTKNTALEHFFKEKYSVGSEHFSRDIPILVLLEMLSTVILVFRNCLFGLLGSKADKVAKHPLFLFGLDYPMRIFNGVVLFMRRAPQWWITLQVVLCISSILVLAVTIWQRNHILRVDGEVSLFRFILGIAIPFLILTAQAVFTIHGRVGETICCKFQRAFIDCLIALLIIFPICFIIGMFWGKENWIEMIAVGAFLYISVFAGLFWVIKRGKSSGARFNYLKKMSMKFLSDNELEELADEISLTNKPSEQRASKDRENLFWIICELNIHTVLRKILGNGINEEIKKIITQVSDGEKKLNVFGNCLRGTYMQKKIDQIKNKVDGNNAKYIIKRLELSRVEKSFLSTLEERIRAVCPEIFR